MRAYATRNHELSLANHVSRFMQHLGSVARLQEYVIKEMYAVWDDEQDRAFHRAASYLTWEDVCRAHNARLPKKRLGNDVNEDWGPFSPLTGMPHSVLRDRTKEKHHRLSASQRQTHKTPLNVAAVVTSYASSPQVRYPNANAYPK